MTLRIATRKLGGIRTLEQCVARWNRDIKITRDFQAWPNHLLISYEEMLEDEEAAMRRVFRAIGLGTCRTLRGSSNEEVIE